MEVEVWVGGEVGKDSICPKRGVGVGGLDLFDTLALVKL